MYALTHNSIERWSSTRRTPFLFAFVISFASLAQGSSIYSFGGASAYGVFAFSNFTSNVNIDTTSNVYAGTSLTANQGFTFHGVTLVNGAFAAANVTTGTTLVNGNVSLSGALTASSNTYVNGAFAANYGQGTVYATSFNVPQYSTYGKTTFTAFPTLASQYGTFASLSNAKTSLTSESADLAKLASTGTYTTNQNGGALTFYASGTAAYYVFNVTAADFANANGVNVSNVPSTATVIVNVVSPAAGATVNYHGAYTVGSSGTNVLFNFSNQANVNFSNGFEGSVIAPLATVSSAGAQFDGQLFANNIIDAGTEFHGEYAFTGSVPDLTSTTSTPEPTTWMMFLVCAPVVYLFARSKFTLLKKERSGTT